MLTSQTWIAAGLVSASAIFWLQYVDLKDHLQKEPRHRLAIAFLLGIGAGALAFGIFTVAERVGIPAIDARGKAWMAFFCFVLIGPIEEGAKILVALCFVFRWQEFDEPIDGFVYAAAISLGFASLENLYQLPALPMLEQAARTAVLPLTHTLFAAVWGLGIAHGQLCLAPGKKRWCCIAGTVILAMVLHGFYDFMLFAYQATWMTSGLILIIWTAVIWRTRSLVRNGGAQVRLGAVVSRAAPSLADSRPGNRAR